MGPRAFAISIGAEYYYSGKPCKHGHCSKRSVKSGCVQCNHEATKKWRCSDEGRAHLAKYRREYALKNADRIFECKKAWRANNPEKVLASAAASRAKATPEQRIRHLEQIRAWRKSHPVDARYRPARDQRKKQQQKKDLFAKYKAAYLALKELGIDV